MTRAAEVLYIWRMKNKKTVADVAKEIGVTVSTIRRLEAGSQFPDGRNILKITNWLWEEMEKRPEQAYIDAYNQNMSRPSNKVEGKKDGTSESASRIESNDSEDGQGAGVESLSGGGY